MCPYSPGNVVPETGEVVNEIFLFWVRDKKREGLLMLENRVGCNFILLLIQCVEFKENIPSGI